MLSEESYIVSLLVGEALQPLRVVGDVRTGKRRARHALSHRAKRLPPFRLGGGWRPVSGPSAAIGARSAAAGGTAAGFGVRTRNSLVLLPILGTPRVS